MKLGEVWLQCRNPVAFTNSPALNYTAAYVTLPTECRLGEGFMNSETMLHRALYNCLPSACQNTMGSVYFHCAKSVKSMERRTYASGAWRTTSCCWYPPLTLFSRCWWRYSEDPKPPTRIIPYCEYSAFVRNHCWWV